MEDFIIVSLGILIRYVYLCMHAREEKKKEAGGERQHIKSSRSSISNPLRSSQMWLDGIYMLDVFYARWTHEFEPDNTTAWDDIALQFDLIDARTTVDRNRTNGLPVHGFDVSKTQVWADPVTGAAPHVWGRAVGW